MKKLLSITLLLSIILSACTEDNTSNYSNPHIEDFYFDRHEKIDGIENLKFTVDTIAGLIYNEDSASYNCDFSRVLPIPDSYESLSSISINDNSWNYTDTIDMNNPIKLSTVGGNKKRKASYIVTINKHTVEPDSIVWKQNIIKENNITSIKASDYNDNIYLFFCNSSGESKIYNSTTGNDFALVYSQANLNLNFYKSAIYNEKCYVVTADNKSVYYLDLSNITSGFSLIELPENTEVIDLWGIINNKLFATIISEQPEYVSYNGTSWVSEVCNMTNELTTVGSAKVNCNNTLFVISGKLNNQLTNNVLATQDGNYWINTINQSNTLKYEPVINASASDYYDYFYLCGGKTKNGNFASSYYSKNDGYTWQPLKSYQRPTSEYSSKENIASCTLKDYILIFNCSNTSNIEVWRGKINKADFIKK